MPDSQAASISSNAWSSVSPWPKNSGAEPTPPKLPQPSATGGITRPELPTGRLVASVIVMRVSREEWAFAKVNQSRRYRAIAWATATREHLEARHERYGMMNGAQALIRTLAACGVDVCFTNPGTSEMHFVAGPGRRPADARRALPVRGRGDRARPTATAG